MRLNYMGHQRGFSKLDVLILLATIAFASIVIIPPLWGPRPRQKAINCYPQVKQVGLALRMYANDHTDQFPWQVGSTNGGTKELTDHQSSFRQFASLSNELVNPKVLACSSDKQRNRNTSWPSLRNLNISYFLNLNATDGAPKVILSGDRNLSTNKQIFAAQIIAITAGTRMTWAPEIHQYGGNIGFADGSAQQISEGSIQNLGNQSSLRNFTFLYP